MSVVVEELRTFILLLTDEQDLGSSSAEGKRDVVLIGHGLGGLVAWYLVDKYPEMFSKFIPIATPHPATFRESVTRNWDSMKKNRQEVQARNLAMLSWSES